MTRRLVCLIALLLGLSALPAVITCRLHRELREGPVALLQEHEITLAMAQAWGTDVMWLDARGDAAYGRGHAPDAISFDPSVWEERFEMLLQRWRAGLKIVVYCDALACDTSKQVATRLREEAGLPDVYFLHGGWEAWQKAHR